MQSATFTESPQANNRKYVTFRFVTTEGAVHLETGLYPNSYNPSVDLAAHAARWDQILADAEIAGNLEEISGG